MGKKRRRSKKSKTKSDTNNQALRWLTKDEKTREQIIEAMRTAKIDPAIIYAYSKTGMIVGESNISQWSESDLAEWNAAIDEYVNEHSDE